MAKFTVILHAKMKTTNLSEDIFLNLSDKSTATATTTATPILQFRRLQTGLNRLSMVPVAVDGLVASLKDDVDLVAGVELVVEAVLAGQDDDDVEVAERPKNEPNDECDA